MRLQRLLVYPAFQQDQLVCIDRTLEYLELFTAGFAPYFCATRFV
jgi:hypothetical protein